jgi:acetyl-CoA carboxylase carboxyltransferase component
MTPRERIARIVDPDLWSASQTYYDLFTRDREKTLRAADRILAAFPEIAGELGYVKLDDTPKQDNARALGLTEDK